MNPAPLLYSFEHEPSASRLRAQYAVEYMQPSECARRLLTGQSDLGLIPVAALTPELVTVPGCAIASLGEVRSILLLVKNPRGLAVEDALREVRTVAADAASRSSQAYARILFEKWSGVRPEFDEQAADAEAMLAAHDAALLIGDPALFARERREAIERAAGVSLLWLDLAALWREHTGLPWVAAVWAVRPQALARESMTAAQLVRDLVESRDAGLAHVAELAAEWAPRTGLPEVLVREYLAENIHYVLDEPCMEAIRLFRRLAAELDILPPLEPVPLLATI